MVKTKQTKREMKNLPGRNRHPLMLVALRAHLLSSKDFSPRAFGRRSLARAGVSSQSIVLLALGHKLVQELLANLGLQRGGVLMDLWVDVG